jgi:hypothetical protein
VRLWVDDLNAFAPMCPGADAAAQQWQQGVDVRHWPAAWLPVAPADVVIGAFACQLPAAYVEAMRPAHAAAVAEPGLPQCRGLGGGLPWLAFAAANGCARCFLPGLHRKTGGLLREGSLLARRDAFQQSARSLPAGLGVNPSRGAADLAVRLRKPAAGQLARCPGGRCAACHLLVPQGRISVTSAAGWASALPVGGAHGAGR